MLRSECSLTYSEPVSRKPSRARPLSPQQRRESIIDAAVPLFIEHGADVTSRQIADAAGIAEGTIFRVFTDKDELIDAAMARYMDPRPALEKLAAIDPALDLDDTVEQMVVILRDRIAGVLGIMHAVGMRKPFDHGVPANPDTAIGVAESVLARHREQLTVEPAVAISLIRASVFGTSAAPFAREAPLDARTLAHFIVHGIAKG